MGVSVAPALFNVSFMILLLTYIKSIMLCELCDVYKDLCYILIIHHQKYIFDLLILNSQQKLEDLMQGRTISINVS